MITFNRSPFSFDNLKAYFQLKKLLLEEAYEIIHCHTPMGGCVARLAAISSRKRYGTKVMYTAHGFHFYKGAPFINWLLYYPMERFLSFFTDCLITMNEEDYCNAKQRKFRAGVIEKIDGVGVDVKRFAPVSCDEKQALRARYDFPKDAFIAICVAEFTKNKNQQFLIKSLPEVKEKIKNLHMVFAGKGTFQSDCIALAEKLQLNEYVYFLGYRTDIDDLYRISDVLLSGSLREGLPINIVEGMATGLPIICTEVRGHTDVVKQGHNGCLYKPNDQNELTQMICDLYNDVDMRKRIAQNNVQGVKKYKVERAVEVMAELYKKVILK